MAQPQPLPATPPLRVKDLPTGISAYNICLRIEQSLQTAANNGRNIGNDLIYIRILGYLIHYVVSDRGLATVVKEIVSAKDDHALIQVGRMYFDHYIRAFKATKGRTPMPSNHASRPSFDTIADMINDTLQEAPQDHKRAKKLAFIRDGYRCVVTGKYDIRMVEEIKQLKDKVMAQGLDSDPTQLAHIFDESTNHEIEPGSAKRDYAASMWAVMRRFGHETLPDTLNGHLVHRLENVMTLSVPFHNEFDRLKVWFVATGKENEYKLEGVNDFWLCKYPEYVTFTTPDQATYPVPDPTYLSIHAACAKVAHLSGAADCVDKMQHDMEDGDTLDPHGGSALLLEQAIFALQASGHGITV